jgi:hypothetical protein
MTAESSIPSLYRGKINLWVEDVLTREYLKGIWEDDPDFFFLIAGGNENIAAILKDAEERGYTNVFGYVDRDFGPSNRANWTDTTKRARRFVSNSHEIENFLLDKDALAGCALNTESRSAPDIDNRLKARASELVWWMACRSVIVELRKDFREDFLEHPKCPDVYDLDSAERYITSQGWFAGLKIRAYNVSAPGEISKRVTAAKGIMANTIDDGSWRIHFSGKELFRHVRGLIYKKLPRSDVSKTELDLDVAKSVARWQVDNCSVPKELVVLRQVMRQRVGCNASR